MVRRIAISMPEPMYEQMEQARRDAGDDRSSWVQQAVAERLRRERRDADVAAYVRGYTEHPDGAEELAWSEAALRVGSAYDDEWPEAPR